MRFFLSAGAGSRESFLTPIFYALYPRFTTYEQVERTELRVIKRDGSREAINREKLFRGLVKACEKRKVSMDVIGRAVDQILSELHKDHHTEVPSASIGAKVMDTLHAIDPVAYVRYVSVYRQFDDVGQFRGIGAGGDRLEPAGFPFH